MTGEPLQGAGGGNDRGLFSALLRRAWIPLLCGAIVGSLAFMVFNSRAKSYDACTYLKVNSAPVDAFILGLPAGNKPISNIIGETAEEIQQFRVAQRAVEELQLKPFANPTELLDAIKAEPDQNSGLITVCARGTTAREAQRIANATSRAYLTTQREREKARLRSARRVLERQQRVRVSRLRSEGTNASRATADAVRESQDQIDRLQLAERINTDTVVLAKPAILPAGAAGIPPWTIGLLGLVLGTALGGALLAVREQTDQRIRTARQLERVVGAPVLASIPKPATLKERLPLDALLRKDAEPFRLIFAKLRNASGAESLRAIAIASVDPDGSSGSVAWYLAATAASSGSRVLLLEADHDRPSAVDTETERPPGVADILSGRHELGDVLFHVAADERHAVDVVSPGSDDSAAHLSGGFAVSELIGSGARDYDLVLVDTPPVDDADAVPFVRHAQGAILVYRRGGADANVLRDARDELASVGTPLLGVVAVGFRE